MINDLPVFPLDHLVLRGESLAPALNIRGTIYTYKELNLRISRLAEFLIERGAQKGDRIATWLNKGEIACIMPLASVRAGLVHVPVNPVLKGAQVSHIMADSGATILICNVARAAMLGDFESTKLDQSNGTTFTTFDEKAVLSVLNDEAAPLHPALPTDFDTDTLAAILYTSGSTGRPKGVMLSHANMVLGAISVAQYLKLALDDVTLAVLPLSFDYGQNQLLSTWYAGGCVVPLDYLTPRDVIKACARYNVTTLAAVPPLWVQLVEQEWPADATTYMRRLTNSGGALTPNLVKGLRSIFDAKTEIFAMYGLTEAFRSTYLDPALIDANPTSMGRGIPFSEIMVVAKDGNEAATGEPGELVHAGPLVAMGYWQDAARTAQRFKPAPNFSEYGGMAVYSGDTVRRDADGLLYFVGRDDAMIKTSGNRVSPTEVEEAAVESGLVAEACALGRKDERLGAVIILYVRAKAGPNEDGLRGYMKANLPNYMQPAEVIWLEAFPKNANGKLDRNALAAQLAD
jgi:acyl-CoA ligase (AMP-forming) (exosortase A-associated)